jgi:hypothetical protein
VIRKCQVIFCDNEHGFGDVCFPAIDTLDGHATQQLFVNGTDLKSLRKAAKDAGWGRVNGGDYCPQCMESM